MNKFKIFGFILIISLSLVGCSNTKNNIASNTDAIEEDSAKDSSFIEGVHDIEVDEGIDPQEMFNLLIKDVKVEGYQLNVSKVNVYKPGEYIAIWSNDKGKTIECKVIVNKVEKPTTEEITTTKEQTEITTTVTTTEYIPPTTETTTERPTTESTTEAPQPPSQPTSRSISGVHNVTKSWSDTSWTTQSVFNELQAGVSCTGDSIMLNGTGQNISGPGTYNFTWIYMSDGSTAATCSIIITE